MKVWFFLVVFVSQLLTVTAAFATATVKFENPVVYGAGGRGTNFVVAADLLVRGCPDMIVANTDGVSVRLNNCDGTGTFGAPVTYGTGGNNAFAVAVADVDNDGFPDLVVTNRCANSPSCSNGGVGVLIGNGDGTFKSAVSYNAGGPETRAVVIGDVNSDGWNDIIVTSDCQANTCVDGSIRLLQNNKDGTFTLSPTPISPSMGGPLAIGDLNGDGVLDLVADVGVLLGNGDGTFQQPSAILPNGTISIAIADVNGDTNMDLVVANQSSVWVQLGVGDGTFYQPAPYKTGGARPLSVAVADFNGDGNLDVAVANECSSLTNNICASTGSVGVLAGNGDGTFATPVRYLSGGYLATSVAVADANGDTKSDLFVSNVCVSSSVCTNGTIEVLLNNFKAATSMSLTSSMNPSNINQLVTFTATMVSSVLVPDGSTVNFFNGTTMIGTGTTTGGIATLGVTFTHSGAKSIKATYSGDIYHLASSRTITQTVNLYASTTMVTSSQNPSTYGTPVTLTATVSSLAPGGPTGTVTFTNTTTNVVFATAPVSGGMATWTGSHLRVGTSTIKATYNGDSQSTKSSGMITQTVNSN